MRILTLLAIILVTVLSTGCGQADTQSNTATATAPLPALATRPAPTTMPPDPPTPAEPGQEAPAIPVPDSAGRAMADLAREQLAATLNVPASEIQTVAIEPVEWPDSSLGCSQPGQMALQVITPGYRIQLAWGDQQYTFHTDRDRVVTRCDTNS